jgi:hypothetical protein
MEYALLDRMGRRWVVLATYSNLGLCEEGRKNIGRPETFCVPLDDSRVTQYFREMETKKKGIIADLEEHKVIEAEIERLAPKLAGEGSSLLGYEFWSTPKLYKRDFAFEPLNIVLGENAKITGKARKGDITILEVYEMGPRGPSVYLAFLGRKT